MAEFLRRSAGFFRDREGVARALERMAEFMPEVALESIKAVEGIRFASRTPWNSRPELTIVASEEGALSGVLKALRGGEPDLVGLLPSGLALQINADPLEAARLMKSAVAFYEEIVDLEDGVAERNLKPLLSGMAHDRGQYLLGIDAGKELGWCVLVSALEGAGDISGSGGPTGPSMVAPVIDLLLPGEEIPIRGSGGGIQRYDFQWEEPLRAGFTLPSIETGCAGGVRVTTLQIGAEREIGALIQQIARLRRMGAGRIPALPKGAALYLKISPPQAYNKAFVPGIENLMNFGIMGSGIVEENRLVINFLH
jgi:hypothetical protein